MASETPLYADRVSGQVFETAHAMVSSYLARFAERAQKTLPSLDEGGYAQFRWGSASVGINLMDEHGILLVLAPLMVPPTTRREEFYRKLLELSFLATSDAAFAIDAEKNEVYVRALRGIAGLDYEEFEDLVLTVARVADTWDDALRAEFATTP